MQDVALPDNQPLITQTAAQSSNGTIAIYCTHTDESYVPTDGAESVEGQGGIVDVAQQIADELRAHNYEVVFDDTNHIPHDAGAYRRSRRTAVQLMKEAEPLAILDIHRDGVPNEEEYKSEIDGEEISRVRLVVGRSNQNAEANKEFATKMKKMADDVYPGLIKDIYMGKGTYNQDIMPRAIIVEMGTHTIEKELALKSAELVADTVAYTLGGAKPGEKGGANSSQAGDDSTANPQGGASPGATAQARQQSHATDDSQGRASFMGIGWIIGIVVVTGIIVLLVAMNSGGRGQRVGNFFRELTGTGKHKK